MRVKKFWFKNCLTSLLYIGYGFYKNEKCICPYLRLTAETKIAIPDGTALGFKPPAF